jgi:hypothetical protein
MVAGAQETTMAISINRGFALSTDHLLLDEQGPTITAFGYEISWLGSGDDPRPGTGRELIVERLSDGFSWNWRRGLGRWRVRNGDIVDGWADRS